MSGAYWDTAWNIVEGCTPDSEGCARCWAATVASRFTSAYPQLAVNGKWSGKVRCREGRIGDPLHWRKPRLVFVANMGDLFHEQVPRDFIERVWWTMAAAPQHTFLVLTKRAARMRMTIDHMAMGFLARVRKLDQETPWPLPNVWLGVTAENQTRLNERLPHLLAAPAAHRWVSFEPMLGPVVAAVADLNRLDWVVVGCESGPGARPMAPNWVRSIRDQCEAAGVPWMLKQAHLSLGSRLQHMPLLDGVFHDALPGGWQ